MGTPLPPVPTLAPTLSKFGPQAIDRAINRALQEAIPGTKDTAVLDLTLSSADGAKVLRGLVAANLGQRWGLVDISGAAGVVIDLENRDDWEVGVTVKAAW
jgi:hypothetical protein